MGAALLGAADDLLGRRADAVIDHLHAAGAGAGGDLLGAVGVTVQARLAHQIGQGAAQHLRDPLDLALHGLDVLGFVGGDDDGDAGRAAILAEHFAQGAGPFAGGDAGLGGGDGGLHDVATLARGGLEFSQGSVDSDRVAGRAPRLDALDHPGFQAWIDRLDGALAR